MKEKKQKSSTSKAKSISKKKKGGLDMSDNTSGQGSQFVERRDESYLSNSIFDDKCLDELQATDKHEIIVKIAKVLGTSPETLAQAEQILTQVKFEITRFVLHHEYCREKKIGIRSNLLIWLESKINPGEAKNITNFFGKYIK